ncbi:MAG: methyltransferase domain-containing protein [Bacteroidetes bacterium]|nr:methyltransferase domain-containing protein [Bacteroidota bacterium]
MLSFQRDGLYEGELLRFALLKGVIRITEKENYTDSFGFQWTKFAKTQIDRYQRSSKQSHDRFFAVTGWDREDLTGKNILEVGSGAGRFSHVVLQNTNANLFSVDYSNAVEANFGNNGPHERLKLFQSSIYELPFAPRQFDKVFCFGVLQHTPDVKESVKCLTEMVKEGGELIVDFYPLKGWHTKIHAKYILRPMTRKMSHDKLLSLIERNAGWLIRTYKFFDIAGVGKLLNRFLPICDIRNTLPPDLSKEELREWVILDTFDMYSPRYDQPQKLETVEGWFKEFGFKEFLGSVVNYDKSNSVTVVRGIR